MTAIDYDKFISLTAKIYDNPVLTVIEINSTTSTIISVANETRLFFHVSNDQNAIGFWLKQKPASIDNEKDGIFISGKVGANPFWEMPIEKYTGEISAIAELNKLDGDY